MELRHESAVAAPHPGRIWGFPGCGGLSSSLFQVILGDMKVYKPLFVLMCFVSLVFFSCTTLLSLLASPGGGDSFTNAEAVEAMKSALNIGAQASSDGLSQDGAYYNNPSIKIPLPPEVDKALGAVSEFKDVPVVGSFINELSGGLVEKVVLGVNRSAEDAAKEVVPIFSGAIADMTVQDGIGIVTGERNAATTYLKEKTYPELMELYQPKMDEALGKDLVGEMSANDAWNTLTSKYNSIVENPAVKLAARVAGKTVPDPINTDLSEYVTGKALDGLFMKVEEEEGKIRDNPLDYASDIVQKVFGAVKSGREF